MGSRQIVLAATLAMFSQTNFAAETMEQRLVRMEAKLAEMQQKLEQEEATIKRLEATIAEQRAFQEGMPKRMQKLADEMEKKRAAEPEERAWYRNIELGGLVEVEAAHHSPFEGESESDIQLSTFELGLTSRLGDWVQLGGSLLYEQDETPLEVDVVYATIANFDRSPLFFTAGQIYLPFGEYHTNMISDPLTLELGETRETAAQLGLVVNGFSGNAYVFSSASGNKGHIHDWGAKVDYSREVDDLRWNLGVSYISDLGDSKTLQDVTSSSQSDLPGGWSVHGDLKAGPLILIGEYLTADGRFDAATLPWRQGGSEPRAWNLEVGYRFDLLGKQSTVAIAYQGSGQALALELPKQRWLLGVSMDILKNTALSFEWAHDRDYGVSDGGTGQSADTLTAQLAFVF